MSTLQEDAKKLLPIIQAAAEGKEIQIRADHPNSTWDDKLRGRHWDLGQWEYRIKPEPRLRPYTREEWEKVDKVRVKDTGFVHAVEKVYSTSVQAAGYTALSFKHAFDVFTHLDGSPCGVEE